MILQRSSYRLAPACLAAALLLFAGAHAAPISPADFHPKGYVNDFAHVIQPEWQKHITRLASVLEEKTKAQVAVVTVNTLEGEPIEDFANRLFESWRVGHQDDRGILLLLVIQDRRSRLEVGYGLEPIIPDGFAGSVLREMRPALRERKYGEALYAGVSLVAQRIAAEAGVKLDDPGLPPVQRRSAPGPGWEAIILLLMALVFFGVLPWWMPGMGVGYRRRQRWWSGGFGGFGGFGRYDTGGSGGGFGGFGGFGGGRSGGGGASSDW